MGRAWEEDWRTLSARLDDNAGSCRRSAANREIGMLEIGRYLALLSDLRGSLFQVRLSYLGQKRLLMP